MAEERRRHLRSNRDALNMKQKTKVNVDRSVKSKSITETHEIITPATVSSRQPYRKSNPHLHVKGQPSNEPRLVQDNIYNCSQHQGEAPTHNRPINVQKQQNNLSPPGAAVRYSKCVQSKRSTQKTLRETSPPCCHKIKQRGLHSIEKRPIGGFQAVSCPKDGGNHTGSEAVINQINPCINITIHPTTSYELDNLFMKPPVLTCPAAEGEEFVQFPEDLNLSFTDGKKCCQTTSNLVSGKSHPWFGTEFFQDLDSLENSYMEPTRTSSYPKVPPSYSHLELASDRVHEVNHFGFCPNIRHPPNVWHTKIQKPDCIVSNQNGEPSPYSDLSLDYPEKQPQIFFSSFDYELVDGPKFSSENEIFRTSTNLPGDFAFGQYSGSQFTELNPFLPSQDDGDVFHERLVDWKEEFGGTSLKKRDAELRRFQNNIETLLETPEKIPPSRYLSFTDRQLLSCCLRAWNRLITEKYECAQKLYECHLLRKGLRALAWAVILQDSRARVLQGKCRRAADEYGSGELEVCLQTEVEKNLLRRCFMRWMRHSRNIQSAQTLHRMTLQRRMFSAWLGHTRQAKERADLVKRWGLLQSGRWALELWRRRLFQTREAQFRHQRKTQAILRVILTGWHRHCQRKKQLSDKLVLWEASCVKRMKRVAMRRWSDQLARRLQAEDYWHRLVLSRCFRFWREKSTDCVLSDKVHDFQMTWNKMKMKVVFGQWKVLSSSRRQCSAILKKRESRMCSRVMGRWRQYTMEVKAEKYLIRRRCCWALTRWTVNFELQVELMKYREIKNLHRMGTYWQIWLLQLQLTVECRLHHRRVLRKRAFATWVSAAHLHGRWREAAARLQFACRHRLLQTCFDRWRTELSLRRQKSDCNHSAAPAMSLHFWRAATRGHQALRLRTQNSVKQACNYWTTAAAVSLRRRCQHVTVGTRKLRKICLSMALDGSQARITGRAFEDQDYEGLTQSAFSRWLLLYRSRRCGEGGEGGNTQEDDKGPLNINPVLSDQENARDLEDNAHLSELLQNFQSRAERICLVRTWTRWKGLHETVSVVQVLNQRRLVEGSWKIWRKRRLQIVTAIQFLDWEKRWLCLKADNCLSIVLLPPHGGDYKRLYRTMMASQWSKLVEEVVEEDQ